jgi:hypothetical protein
MQAPPKPVVGLDKAKESLVAYGMQLFYEYAEQNSLDKPLDVRVAEGNMVTGYGVACLWHDKYRTAINIQWNYYPEFKEIEKRCRAWRDG